MAPPSSALWLLLVAAVISSGCCQHWSFGLSPGGKRELLDHLDHLSDTPDNIVEELPHMDASCSVLRCGEQPTLTNSCRRRGALGGVTKRERKQK